jgi:hypothetical protein
MNNLLIFKGNKENELSGIIYIEYDNNVYFNIINSEIRNLNNRLTDNI